MAPCKAVPSPESGEGDWSSRVGIERSDEAVAAWALDLVDLIDEVLS
jgi:hypothetical protein